MREAAQSRSTQESRKPAGAAVSAYSGQNDQPFRLILSARSEHGPDRICCSTRKYAYYMHNQKVDEFEFDPTKARANLRKHGGDFSHAEQALRDPGGVTIEDPDAKGEQRFASVGMDALGRILVVIHTPRGDRVRIISARKASRGEMEDYHA